MNTYEVNNETLALLPIENNVTKVYEKNKDFIVNSSVMTIIENSCSYFGSSYYGRHEGTKRLIGVSYKAPIIIEETKNLIFFPTTSPRLNSCSWISLKYIKDYKAKGNSTIVQFENGKSVEINISFGSFDNQYLRATKLESILRKRILNIE